jgi:hypothetical protein
VVEVDDRREEREPAAQPLRLEREVAQEEEPRGEGEEPEDPVAEDRERGVELDPRVVAEDVGAPDGVPLGNREGEEGEGGAEARAEVAQDARAEGRRPRPGRA